MKKLLSLILIATTLGFNAHAGNTKPVPGGYLYGDVLYSMVLGDVTNEFDQGMEWSIEVSSNGKSVSVSVYCDDGYSIYDETLDNTTTSAAYDENDELAEIRITDNNKNNAPILEFILQDGQWVLIVEGE